jgi:hypothetical protein
VSARPLQVHAAEALIWPIAGTPHGGCRQRVVERPDMCFLSSQAQFVCRVLGVACNAVLIVIGFFVCGSGVGRLDKC